MTVKNTKSVIFRLSHTVLVILSVLLLASLAPLSADTINLNTSPYELGPATPLSYAAKKHLFKWLPPERATQHAVFKYLYIKSGEIRKATPLADTQVLHGPIVIDKVGFVACPTNFDLLPEWFSTYYQSTLQEDRVQYGQVYSNLLLAHDLLNQSDQRKRMLGFRVAYYCVTWASRQIKDKWISARIYDAFLLPHLDMAYTQSWRSVNQEQIMNGAIDAYDQNTEQGKQIAALQILVNFPASPQTADRARLILAAISSSLGHYESSIGYLNAIKSSDLKNNSIYIADLRRKKKSLKADSAQKHIR